MTRTHRNRVAVSLVALFALSLSSCNIFKVFMNSSDKKKTDTPAAVTLTITTLVGEMSKSLTDAGFSSAEAAAAAKGANDAAAATKIPLDNIDLLIDVAVGGAVGSVGNIATLPDDAARIKFVDTITSSFVASLNGRFAATSSQKSSRAISEGANAIKTLLARISRAAVTNLASTGISAARRGEAASAVVGTMIGSLDDGGVNKMLVNEVLGTITEAAVSSLKAAGLDGTAALQTAVQSITQGAVAAVASIQVEGVAAADYPVLASEIAKGAAAAIGQIASASTPVDQLIGSVATGAAAGVAAVKTQVSGVDNATVLSMIQGVTSGATVGVMSIDSVSDSSAATLIGAITAGASQELSAKAAVLGTAVTASANAEVTKGAAAAAQTALAVALDATALASAIQLKDSGGAAVAVVTADITAGIVIGSNTPPVADAGTDKTVEIGAAVSLDGSKSHDAEDAQIAAYAWSFVSKPATSAAAISNAAAATASFTPDVTGTYLVSLKVTDSKGAIGTAYCSIGASPSATSATYLGKTAADRLASAKAFFDAKEFPKARDEYLIILTKYPSTTIFAEATYMLGRSYLKMENYALALARFQETADSYPGTDFEAKSLSGIATIRIWNLVDLGKAEAATAALEAKNLQTVDGLYGKISRGWLGVFQSGNFDGARTLFIAARDSAAADLGVRFNAQESIASSYQRQGNTTQAETEYQKLFNEAKYYCATPTDASTLDHNYLFKGMMDLNWLYQAMGISKKDARIANLSAIRLDQRLAEFERFAAARYLAEAYLWDFEQTKANYETALSTLAAAMASFSGSDVDGLRERAWATLRLGQTNQKLRSVASLASDRMAYMEAAAAAFDKTVSDFGLYYFGYRIAGEAKCEKAGLLYWQKKDFAGADALLKNLIATYPDDVNPYPKPRAYFRLGEIYRDEGWNYKNQYGRDYQERFLQAIAFFQQVKQEYYPTLSSSQYFFLEAPWQIGNCKNGLGLYAQAYAILEPLLDAGGYSASSKASIALEALKARCEETRQLSNNARFTEAAATEAAIIAAYNKVATYTSGGSPVNAGRQVAEAAYELGRIYQDVAWDMEDSGLDKSLFVGLWQKGVDASGLVTWTAYPNLDPTLSIFYNSLIIKGRCLEGVEQWQSAIDVYQLTLSNIPAKIPDYRAPTVNRKIGQSYQRHAYTISVQDATSAQEAATLHTNAIAAFTTVINSDRTLDGGNAASYSLANALSSHKDLMWIGYWDGANPGYESALLANAAAAQTLFDSPTAFKAPDGSLYGGGGAAANGMRQIGTMYQHLGKYYSRLQTPNVASARAAFNQAIALFAQEILIAAADPYDTGKSRQELVRCRIYLAQFLESDEATQFEAAWRAADEAIADQDTEAQFIARICDTMGWAFVNLGPGLVGKHVDITSDVAWQTYARLFFNIVLANQTKFSGIDGGAVWTSCQNGFATLPALPTQ